MVKRYWPENGYDSVMRACASMKEAPDGAYVDYADYRDLAKRCESLEAALRGLHREVEALVEDETLPHEAINHPSMIAAREALRSGT